MFWDSAHLPQPAAGPVLGGSATRSPPGLAARRGGGRASRIDSSGGWTDGWMERQMCMRDGWTDGWIDGEIDGCVGEEDARIDRQMESRRSRPERAWGAELWHHSSPSRLIPGSYGAAGWPWGFQRSLTSTDALGARGQVAPQDPAGPALQLFHVTRRAWLTAFPKCPPGCYQGWQQSLIPLRAHPFSLSLCQGLGFHVPAVSAGVLPCSPPAPRPGSCTGAKAANSQLFSCILKIRGLGNIEQMSGRMRRGGINGLAPGRQHLGSPGVTTWPPHSVPCGPPSRQHEGLLRCHIPALSLPIPRLLPSATIPIQARRHIPLRLRSSPRRRTVECWGWGGNALLSWHLLPLPFSRECTRFRCRFGGLAHGAVSPCGAVDVGFDHHFQGAQQEFGLGGLPTALILSPGVLGIYGSRRWNRMCGRMLQDRGLRY